MVRKTLKIVVTVATAFLIFYGGYAMGWKFGWAQGQISAELRSGATVVTAVSSIRKKDVNAITFLDRRLAEIANNIKIFRRDLPKDRIDAANHFFSAVSVYQKDFPQAKIKLTEMPRTDAQTK